MNRISPDSVAVEVKLSDRVHQPSEVTGIYDPPESGLFSVLMCFNYKNVGI